MNTSELVSEIDAEISRLKEARALLAGHDGPFPVLKRRHKLSASARARIAAAQKRRWAKQKRAAKMAA